MESVSVLSYCYSSYILGNALSCLHTNPASALHTTYKDPPD